MTLPARLNPEGLPVVTDEVSWVLSPRLAWLVLSTVAELVSSKTELVVVVEAWSTMNFSQPLLLVE